MSNERELRILQIVKGIDIGGNNGGSENFGIRLARQLRQVGVDVSLCAYYRYNTPVESWWVEQLNKEGIRVVFANHSSRTNLYEGYWNLARFLNEYPVDLVHSHFQVGTLTCILLKIAGKVCRIVRTAHILKEFGDGLLAQISRKIFLQGVFPFFIDSEVGVSRAIVQGLDLRLFARLIGKKALCIHNALPDAPATKPTNNPLESYFVGMECPPWVITMVGVLIPRKSFDTAIRAMPQILTDLPNARLVLVGSGPEEDRLRRLADDFSVIDQVVFLGQRSDVLDILANTDLFVLPSLLEGLSSVILEAMQCGVPVVASNIPGNNELIEDDVNGRLFPPKDVSALAQTILEVYQFPERSRDYVTEGFRRIGSYAISVVTDVYLQLYQELIWRNAS